jgi:hypothetical protein
LVEFPPMKSVAGQYHYISISREEGLTVLVKENDIASSQVNGVGSAQAGHCRRR